MSRINDPTMCDYCHQRPKYLYVVFFFACRVWLLTERAFRVFSRPYDFCSRTCGSLAAGARNQIPAGPVMCKVGGSPSIRSLEGNDLLNFGSLAM